MKRKRRKDRARRYYPSRPVYQRPTRVSRPRQDINRSLAWFAVWTRPRAERQVEIGLRGAGFDTFLPSAAQKVARRGGVMPVEGLPVGRYLFVGLKAAEPQFGAVRDVDGVTGIINAGGVPLRFPASAVQAYADELAAIEVVFRGGGFGRLMAIMAQADEARARERGPFWRGEAA
jgi:hypothetical protein